MDAEHQYLEFLTSGEFAKKIETEEFTCLVSKSTQVLFKEPTKVIELSDVNIGYGSISRFFRFVVFVEQHNPRTITYVVTRDKVLEVVLIEGGYRQTDFTKLEAMNGFVKHSTGN